MVNITHSDVNAERNIKAGSKDNEISRFTPYLKVRKILLNRLHATEELALNHKNDKQ